MKELNRESAWRKVVKKIQQRKRKKDEQRRERMKRSNKIRVDENDSTLM